MLQDSCRPLLATDHLASLDTAHDVMGFDRDNGTAACPLPGRQQAKASSGEWARRVPQDDRGEART